MPPAELALPALASRRRQLARLEAEAARNETDPAEREYWLQAAEESWQTSSLLSLRKAPRPRPQQRGPRARRVARRQRVTSGPRKARAPDDDGSSGDVGEPGKPPGCSPSPHNIDLLDVVALHLGWKRVAA
jgi:hypothetical protein